MSEIRYVWRAAVLLLLLPLLLMVLTAMLGCAPRPAGRVAGVVSDAARKPLSGTAPFAAVGQADLGPLADQTQLSHMVLLLQPSAEQSRALTDLLAAQVDPSSPLYQRWLTPDEFGARFGVAKDELQAVTSWLGDHGFTIDEVPAGRRAVLFSGTAAQFSAAFATELHRYRLNGQVRIANQGPPSVPSALAPVIAGLLSVNDARRVAAHHDLGIFRLDRSTGAVAPVGQAKPARRGSKSGATPEFTTTIGTKTYQIVAPFDFATIYNLKPLWSQGIDGTGQSIAIVSRSDLDLRDVDKFRANFGLPAAKVNKIYANANPGVTPDVAETALDVEWSGAVAKNATIDLVIAGSTLTSDGVDLSALYIVNNNVAPVVSVSYGACELIIGQAGNAFYNALWQQAAAQGQTVFVSSGDSGSTDCDNGANFSTLGLSVNGLGSTPYNVAVGGTDLYGNHTSASTYWSTTNDPATLASALRYVPEIPWNDSCGNPLVLSALRAQGFTDASTAELCNDDKISDYGYRNTTGGGGGVSNCIRTSDETGATCSGGYPKPAWQTGDGVPTGNARQVPDVSLFAGDGLWGSFYPYCVTSQTQGGICDLSVSTNIQGAGGTSFASPAFAGIMALVNQKTGSIQGNANPAFYRLAANQRALDCSVESAAPSASCIYHDIDSGGNATPCFREGGAKDCSVSAADNSFGVVAGYAATKGYDPAIGLGSVDITNLVNGWSSATTPRSATTTTLMLDATSTTYGSGPTATVVVSSAAGTPTGDFAVLANGLSGRPSSDPEGSLSKGTGTLKLARLPAGTYPITAHYAGDGSFAASDSAPQTVTIAKAPTSVQVAPSRTEVTPTQESLLAMTIAASGAGAPPTGTITVTNTTTAVVLGTFAVAPGAAASALDVDIDGTQLTAGANLLSLAYSGDGNYAGSSATVSLAFAAPFTAALSPSSVTVGAAATPTSASSSSTLTVAAAAGGAPAYPITLGCSGTLPAGAACELSTTVLDQPSTTATVDVRFDPRLASLATPTAPARRPAQRPIAALAVLAVAMLLGRRRRLPASLINTVVLALPTLLLVSCGGGHTQPAASASVSLSASSTTVDLGGSVTLRSTVTSSNARAKATGTVSLMDHYLGANRSLGTAPLGADGNAALTVTTLGLGAHSITAVLDGDDQHAAARSSAVTVTVGSTATLRVRVTDARGYTMTLPLAVSFQ